VDPIQLSIFASRVEAVCDEMGAVLRTAAFSPNIRDRLDFSCAIFDPDGGLCAQAAHIPVHLGSMAYAMRDLVRAQAWQPGDQLIVNDPYLGGTHLPDVTLVAPVFDGSRLLGFVANRAHHADIGASAPGSMPLSTNLDQEGVVIPPTLLMRGYELQGAFLDELLDRLRNRSESQGDLAAQLAANHRGVARLSELIGSLGEGPYLQAVTQLNHYAGRLAAATLQQLPDGLYQASDVLDDDGQGYFAIPLQLQLEIRKGHVVADFSGTSAQVAGNMNCPLSVTAAAVWYVFRCLMPEHTPSCAGAFADIELRVPAGSLLNAQRPAAVAAGNVETSTRVVDLVLAALAQALPQSIPAASQGSMNNVALGGDDWDYYETIGGGMGGGPQRPGLSGVQTHMTNTLNTPVEVLEQRFPLQVLRYRLRRGSGGIGQRQGGDGLVRSYRFLASAQAALLTERRLQQPWGLAGGGAGAPGRNLLNGQMLPPKCALHLVAGDELTIETPGGGGHGAPARGQRRGEEWE
jgi:N-methylhydantoinase B